MTNEEILPLAEALMKAHTKSVIDEFLAAVVKEMHKGYFTDRDCTTIHMIFNQVYAERYGNSL